MKWKEEAARLFVCMCVCVYVMCERDKIILEKKHRQQQN